MEIVSLEWDSKFFGYEIGKVSISKNQGFDFDLFSKLTQPFKLVYIFSDEKLDGDSIQLVDQKVVFTKQLERANSFTKPNQKIKNFNKENHSYKNLKELAFASGIHSRFNTDVNFNENEFERLYTQWVDTSIMDKDSFEILIHQENDEMLGFITVDKKQKTTGKIGLIAVNGKSRGMGIATQLIEEAQLRVLHLGLDTFEVVTQLNNTPAMKLYEKCGFKIKEIKNIYHHWNI